MKAKQLKVKVKDVKKVSDSIFLLCVSSAYLASQSQPGQFLHIKIRSTILRRPLSVHKVKGKEVYVLFKIRGKGTEILSHYKKGEALDVIGPLGNGFDLKLNSRGATNILVAGGIGVAPLMFLAEKLKGKTIVLLGARTKKEIVCEPEFKRLGCKVDIATEDGSRGMKATAIELLRKALMSAKTGVKTNIYACGPEVMLEKINNAIEGHPELECQVSFEQFMGCGLGVCCGCTIETKHGYKKVCKDGPVFNIKDVW